VFLDSLGLSSTAPRSDSRLKALFWPTIRHDGDLEYITEQGFWICLTISVVTYCVGAIQGHPIASLLDFGFYFLAGVGVRQRSLAASIIAFTVYLASHLILRSGGILMTVFLALLLANVRGIWISSRWSKENTLPPVERLNDTFFDKLSGRWPEVLWPKTKWLFFILAAIQLLSLVLILAFPRAVQPPIR